MPKYWRPTVRSGDPAVVSGYYIYHGSPFRGVIKRYLGKGENVVVLEEGQIAPALKSYNNEDALWQLVVEKRPNPVQNIVSIQGSPFK